MTQMKVETGNIEFSFQYIFTCSEIKICSMIEEINILLGQSLIWWK